MLNLELQMISLLSSCKINEKLKAWTVNHDSVVGVAHYQRKIINNQEVILKQLFLPFSNTVEGNLSPWKQFIKSPFFIWSLHVTQALGMHPCSSDYPTKTPLPDLVLKSQSFYSSFSTDSASQKPKRIGLEILNLAWSVKKGSGGKPEPFSAGCEGRTSQNDHTLQMMACSYTHTI